MPWEATLFAFELPYAQHDVSDALMPCHRVDLLDQCRLEKHQLLQPERIIHYEVEFSKSDLIGLAVLCDLIAGDLRPALLKL